MLARIRTASYADLSAIVLLVAFGLLVLQPVLHAEFVLVDDHEILRLTLPDAPAPLSQLSNRVLSDDRAAGRFRPIYWVARLGETTLLTDHAPAWHALVLGLGLVSAALLYATWRGLGVAPVAALLFGAWLLVAPGASSNWVRLGTNETIAMPFFVLAMLAAVKAAGPHSRRAWDLVFIVAGLGAMLSKESFALAAPALAGFRVLADRRTGKTTWSRSALLMLVVGLGVAALDYAVARQAGGGIYGGAFLNSPEPRAYLLNAGHNLAILGFVASGWLIPLIVWAARGRSSRCDWQMAALATGVALLLILPQVLLYSREGIFEGKYEVPAAIGVAGWVVAGLAWLQRRGARNVYALGVGCWAVAVGAYAFSTWSYASFFAEDSIQLQRLVAYVASAAPAASIVAVAGNPAADYEPILSMVDQLAHAGRADLTLKVLAIAPDGPYSPQEAELAQALMASNLAQPLQAGANDCAGLGAVIVLHDEAAARQALPCVSDFERVDLSAQVLVWGGDQVSLRPRLPGPGRAGYVVLVPRNTLGCCNPTSAR